MIVRPNVANENRPAPSSGSEETTTGESEGEDGTSTGGTATTTPAGGKDIEQLPTRFQGTVMISSERPARDMHQIVEAIIEHLTTIPGASVELKLEIDAEVPSGIDKGKSRTLLENASTLGFIDKEIG